MTILGLGTAPVGEGPPDVQEAVKVFGAALDAGINYVDTARQYYDMEKVIGQIFPAKRDKVWITTKLQPELVTPDVSAENLMKVIEESLERLLALSLRPQDVRDPAPGLDPRLRTKLDGPPVELQGLVVRILLDQLVLEVCL